MIRKTTGRSAEPGSKLPLAVETWVCALVKSSDDFDILSISSVLVFRGERLKNTTSSSASVKLCSTIHAAGGIGTHNTFNKESFSYVGATEQTQTRNPTSRRENSPGGRESMWTVSENYPDCGYGKAARCDQNDQI